MIKIASIITLSLAFLLISSPQTSAQTSPSQLNQLIKSESSSLGTLEKDLSPELDNLQGMAKKLGDPNLSKQMGQLTGSSHSLGTSTNLMNEVTVLARQVRNIPGVGQMFASFQNTQAGSLSKRFNKPTVVSHLLQQFSASQQNNSAGSSQSNREILGNLSIISQLTGAGAGGQNTATQAELNQAGQVMPAAIKNLEQENQEVKQLLSE